MQRNNFNGIMKLLLVAIVCLVSTSVSSKTEINVETAGTLSSLLTSTEKELKVTGFINGTDIKYIRSLVTAGTVISLDWSEVRIVSGGEAYYGSYTTENDIIGEQMFYQCSKLQEMVLPATVSVIKSNAFANSGLQAIDIPNSVRSIGEDAFAYCNSLATVVVGKKVNLLSKGVFYGSAVTKAYVKPITPPSPPSYLFSSSPKIYVYSDALADYKELGWSSYGTLSGTLANYYPQEPDEDDQVNELCGNFFEDAACTQLKAEYQAMSDEELTAAFTEAGMPDYMVGIALKIKNQSWANYEQEFRIHSYKAYSDAKYWNDKLWSRAASYMGNPTGILCQSYTDQLYVFVDSDVPSDATLYIAGIGVDKMISSGKTGQKLKKGLNIIDGDADKLYYILYTAETKSMTKRLSEWPEIKIHIEGGKVEGYFDASRHTDADYKKLLAGAAHSAFVMKGKHSVLSIWTSILKKRYPNKIAKTVECTDSLSVWEKDITGICESVANGEKAGAPWYITGGDAFYPGYFNNPTFVDNDSPGSYAHANEFGIHLSEGASQYFLNPYSTAIDGYDEGGIAHEFGHQLQSPFMLEGVTEGSNDLFANVCRFLMGHRASTGRPLSVTMQEFARHEPFYWRPVDNSCLRMYYSLYLYYHQAQKNTSFYPELFKALRKDKIAPYGSNTNNSGLKFVRKVCEVAQEDLTDFFTVYGFFEPANNRYLECYGDHYVTNRQIDINSTKKKIAQYPVKNRGIIFVEDRVESVPTTGFVTTAGKQRYYRGEEQLGQCGDVGQFTSYLPGACEPSEYVYLHADSLFAMEGKGGLGFLMLDEEGNIMYAANAKDFCVPSSILHSSPFTLHSLDADGSLHEVAKAGEGEERVTLERAGQLQDSMSDMTIKLILGGKINGTDIKHMRKLITEKHLASIDLTEAQVTTGGVAYYSSYKTSNNIMGECAFQGFTKLVSMRLPQTLTQIGSNAFSRSGLKMIEVPDKVTTIGEDAFAYCDNLSTVIIGKGAKSLSKGAFYESKVKDVYVKAATPPSVSSYLFSSKPIIHVYSSALGKYKSSGWAEYGTIVGDLDEWEQEYTTSLIEMRNERVKGEKDTIEIYDLSGRRIDNGQQTTDNMPRGIYIQNGKKVLMR
ncbi:MAG: leucine-rich repeat protein [Bacteroidaceae bacterium]|nr:leucine-rich repeat protein [Bacteroidaceae bacterium]